MDAKTLKAALKTAREGVKAKNYAQVHKTAEEILKSDANNYHGLVFLGISLPEVDPSAVKRAVDALKKAGEVGPDQPLAWQGLATLYEKNPIKVYQEALPDVYKRLMTIYEKAGGDILDKYFDVGVKLAKIYLDERHKDPASSAETYELLLNKAESLAATDNSQSTAWTKQVARSAADSLAHRVKELPKERGALVEKIFVVLVTVDDDDTDTDLKCTYYEKWIGAMLANGRPAADIVGAAGLMRDAYPDALFPLRLLTIFELSLGCCVGEDVGCGGGGESVSSMVDLEKLEDLRSSLRKVDAKSPLIAAIDGVDAFVTRNYVSARNSLKSAFDASARSGTSNLSIAVFLARAHFVLHDRGAVKTVVNQAKTALKDVKTKNDIANAFVSVDTVHRALDFLSTRAKIEGATSEEDVEAAIAALERLLTSGDGATSENPLAAFIGSSSSLSIERIEEMLETAKRRGFPTNAGLATLEGVLLSKKGDMEAATQRFVVGIESFPDHGPLRFWLGKTLWDKTAGKIANDVLTEDDRESNREELDVCFSELLLAAKLDRFYAPTFLYLGHYYSRVAEETDKALKCYRRAFDLDNCDGDAGSRCVDILSASGRAAEALALLMDVTGMASPSRATKWAWLRLAVRHLDVGDYDAAVKALQDLLKSDAGDWTIWECLGEAYSSRGSHTAALKAFERAIELNPRDAAFSRFQTAHIKRVTGAYLEAVADYEELLKDQPDFIPVLIGMGGALVQLARQALDRFFNRKAVDLIERAVAVLTHAASLRPDLVCVWKLLGDACTILRLAPDLHCAAVKMPAKLAHDPDAAERKMKIRKIFNFETSWDVEGHVEPASNVAWDEEEAKTTAEPEEAAKGQRVRVRRNRRGKDEGDDSVAADPTGDKEVDKLESLLIGNRCYKRALKLSPESGHHALLHDLAFNYIAQMDAVDDEDVDSRKELASNALECLKEAVSLDSTNYLYWLGLGTVAACAPAPIQSPPLAQHAFIKSIQCESNNVIAWTNLGALYLTHGPPDRKLAHLAFKTAQNIDPGYVGCWVGQAMIAEDIGDAEAMDLFRVTVSMENNAIHAQGLVGYGHWVCKMLVRDAKLKAKEKEDADENDHSPGYPPSSHLRYIFDKMGAVHVAADALNLFCDRYPENVEAASMLAILLERQGLLQSAANHLRRALERLRGLGLSAMTELDTVRSNFARILRKLRKYEDAVVQYKQLSGLEKNPLHMCCLGLTLFKAGNLTEAYVIFEKCADFIKDTASASRLACLQTCLAMVAHKYNDLDGAKANLFKGVQFDPSFVPGMVALASVGIIQNDPDLTVAALRELLDAPALPEPQTYEVVRLYTSLMLEEGDYKAGKAQIQKAILRHPQSSRMWTFLAQYILRYAKGDGAMASVAARSAQAVDPSNQDGVLLESLGTLVSSSPLDRSPKKKRYRMSKSAISAAAKAVHLYPDRPEAWSSLTAAAYAMDVVDRVSPEGESLAREGAAVAASRSALAIATTKISSFVSTKIQDRLHAFVAKHHVFNLLISGDSDALREAKRLINDLKDRCLEATGQLLFNLEMLVSKGVNNRTMESFKEAVQWENSLFAHQLLMDVNREAQRLADVKRSLESLAYTDHPGKVVFQSLLIADSLTELARIEDPFSAKTDEAQKVLGLLAESQLKEVDSNLAHLVNGVALFKSNIKQAQKSLLKVHNAKFPAPISDVPGRIARRLLLQVLGGKKEKERDTLESLRNTAVERKDTEFLRIYEQVVPAL